MILTLDLGNTNLLIGVYHERNLIATYRTFSDKTRSSDGYKEIIAFFLKQEAIPLEKIEGAILSSVIPSLSKSIVHAVEKLLNIPCMVVGQKLKSGLSIRIDNPNELGADLVSDSVGAITKYGGSCLVIDLGTATKYLVIDNNKNFVGCVITSGIKLSYQSLASNTALLMEIDYETPRKIIGKNSRDSLNSGATYGTIAQMKSMAEMIEKEIGYKLKKIVTGGNANIIVSHLDSSFTFDPNLILDGLLYIYEKNVAGGKENE